MKRLGLLVNPIGGMGGAVGLHGTDGPALAEARRRGAASVAAARARPAFDILARSREALEVLSAGGEMGEDLAREAGFSPMLIFSAQTDTSAADTRAAADAMRRGGADLILFAGGDGTARDIFAAVGASVPILGIPAGVKMHSAVFATRPQNAGRLALEFLTSGAASAPLQDAEIMDRDEDGSSRLYGFARTPTASGLRQAAKASSAPGEEAEIDAACRRLVAQSRDERVTIIGPGTTTRRLKLMLGPGGTLSGVDAYSAGRLVAADAGEAELLALTEARPARIIMGVVGGQGHLFGRGNQQISWRVIQRVGKANIVVLATPAKLVSVQTRRLFVDTGDAETDRMMAGYISVMTGPDRRVMMRVVGS